jgi:NADPH:quinone reductase-like Zn-dependent oxidoreductase
VKAALQDAYGPPERIQVREVPDPVPTEDRILVRVHAASVNRADLDGLGPRPGFLRLFAGLRRPRIPRTGIDVAGVVEAVGPAVTRFQPGDRVFADLFPASGGAFAELAMGRERLFERIPDERTFEEAATLPHSAVLAAQGLRLRDGRTIQPGDKVLVDGASGNVGPFAVQIAKAMGAEVTATCRAAKADFVRSLGADHVIDFTTTDYTRQGVRYDWIVDTDSHHSPFAVRRALRRGGVYVTLGGGTRAILASMVVAPVIGLATGRRMGLMFWWKPFHRDDVRKILDLIASGAVTPRIDRRYRLDQIVEALRWVDDRHAQGKVIVTP